MLLIVGASNVIISPTSDITDRHKANCMVYQEPNRVCMAATTRGAYECMLPCLLQVHVIICCFNLPVLALQDPTRYASV